MSRYQTCRLGEERADGEDHLAKLGLQETRAQSTRTSVNCNRACPHPSSCPR